MVLGVRFVLAKTIYGMKKFKKKSFKVKIGFSKKRFKVKIGLRKKWF